MSAALESLMRDIPRQRPRQAGGLFAFIAVGGASAMAFVVLSTLAIRLDTGLADWVVSTACYAAFVLPVYLLHRRFSFGSRVAHGTALPRYVLVQGVGLLLTALFALLFHQMLGLPAALAAMLVVGATIAVNYLVLRRWAFAEPRSGAVPA